MKNKSKSKGSLLDIIAEDKPTKINVKLQMVDQHIERSKSILSSYNQLRPMLVPLEKIASRDIAKSVFKRYQYIERSIVGSPKNFIRNYYSNGHSKKA